jgi:hypothetical protein
LSDEKVEAGAKVSFSVFFPILLVGWFRRGRLVLLKDGSTCIAGGGGGGGGFFFLGFKIFYRWGGEGSIVGWMDR